MALEIRKVSKDQLPKTNVPGRQRQPSDFDEIMEEAFNDGEWRAVNFDGTKENLAHLLSELNRATVFYNYGKSIRGGLDEEDNAIVDDEGKPVFYFQIREKLKTGRRGPRNAEGAEVESDDDETADETSVVGEDVGLGEIAESVEDAKSSKRGRKNHDPVTAGSW